MTAISVPQYVALDRDGTLIRYVPYLTKCEDVDLAADAGPAIARLNRLGAQVVLVTNQSLVSRGVLTMKSLNRIHERVSELLGKHDAHLDEILVCPHAPSDRCSCRKPLPGLLMKYLKREGLDPREGFVVGDNITDIELALNLAAKPVHVQMGIHSNSTIHAHYAEVPSVPSLGAAIDFILGESR